MNYPLYNRLNTASLDIVNIIDDNTIKNSIMAITAEKREILYSLMIHYIILNPNTKHFDIMPGILQSDLVINLESIPSDLKHILYVYSLIVNKDQ